MFEKLFIEKRCLIDRLYFFNIGSGILLGESSDLFNNIEQSRVAGPAGIEPTTPGLKARCSILAELRAHLGGCEMHSHFEVFIGFEFS
jgi:hypothetical protein